MAKFWNRRTCRCEEDQNIFECLAGVHYKDTTAKISIDGKEVTIKNPADAIKAGISFATEDRKGTGLVLQRSIGENMSLPLLEKI